MYITKSKYVVFTRCPLKAWYEEFDPLPPNQDDSPQAKEGTAVGVFARDYFGAGSWVFCNQENPQKAPGIYAEYRLKYQDLLCDCDLLRINNDGSIDIYEVKASTNVFEDKKGTKIKHHYLADVCFQYYVATKLGLSVRSVNLLHLNKDYVYDGGPYIMTELFKPEDLTDEVKSKVDEVESNIIEYRAMNAASIPTCQLKAFCKNYGGCQYLGRCKTSKGLPNTMSTYDLYGNCGKYNLIEQGYRSFQDVHDNEEKWGKLSEFNKVMIETSLGKGSRYMGDTYVDASLLKGFMASLQTKLPLFFFDFETVQYAIPIYPKSRPYEKIPFQYSLHIMRKADDTETIIEHTHKYYLGDGISDPRKELINQMISDLETEGAIVAYNDDFEKGQISGLSRFDPAHKVELDAIEERFVDLKDVFSLEKRPAIYHKKMGPSVSIKYVLPAFFSRSDLDYSRLGQVHNGLEAIDAYKKLKDLPTTERDVLRKDMLDYCHLDTFAMVVLYLRFLELAGLNPLQPHP